VLIASGDRVREYVFDGTAFGVLQAVAAVGE
jgi:hypothetical protein